jgi:hypothetical protein
MRILQLNPSVAPVERSVGDYQTYGVNPFLVAADSRERSPSAPEQRALIDMDAGREAGGRAGSNAVVVAASTSRS